MQRDYKAYLNDILKAINRVEAYTENLALDDFSESSLYQDAVIRNLEIIGEAVKHIPSNLRKKIAGLRDILAHTYFGIDIEIVWDVVQNKLPEFKEQITLILSKIKNK